MKLAPIPPTDFIDLCTGFEYQFCLSFQALKDEFYALAYRDLARRKEHYVIMDNGTFEHGSPNGLEDLIAAIELVRPHEVVLPDRLYHGEKTIAYAEKAVPHLRGLFPNVKLMGVPQGISHNEWNLCARRLLELGVDSIAVQKGFSRVPGGRALFVQLLSGLMASLGIHRPVHLLGWSDGEYWTEFKTLPCIRSVDTVKPFTCGFDRRPFVTGATYVTRPEDYFSIMKKHLPPDRLQQVVDNLAEWSEKN